MIKINGAQTRHKKQDMLRCSCISNITTAKKDIYLFEADCARLQSAGVRSGDLLECQLVNDYQHQSYN